VACLFCEIVAGRMPARVVRQDEDVVAFHDIHPQAPVHVLFVPRRHIDDLQALLPGDEGLVGRLVRTACDVAREMGLGERGFRLNLNAGDDAGYSVPHVHLHLLGGRRFGWPPG
jgi:histidine triad (HIT) family protein